MKAIFDKVSNDCSEITTKAYSTSFSLGIKVLDKSLHNPIYGIYGFVRFAVKTFNFVNLTQENKFKKLKSTYLIFDSNLCISF